MRARLHFLVPTASVFIACAATTVGSISVASAAATDSSSSNYSQSSFILPFTGKGNLAVQGHMVVNPTTGDVFVSGGQTTSFVEVMSAGGQPLDQIPAQSGAMGLALSADGGTLYVADYGSDSISVIDTATLTQTASYPTPGLAPVSLALSGGKLWFTDQNDSKINEVDLSTGVVSTTNANTSYFGAMLTASPSAPNVLVSGIQDTSPATVYVFNIASGTPVETAGGWLGDIEPGGCANLGGMAITPDGQSLILACGAPYYGIQTSLSTMAVQQTYATGPYPSAVAMSSDGRVLIGVGSGTPPFDEFELGDSNAVAGVGDVPGAQIQGVAWGPDDSTTYALLTNPVGANPLTFMTVKQYPSLSLAVPSTAQPGTGYTVSGALSLMGDPVAGTAVTVTRTLGSSTSTVGTFTTNASGAFSFGAQPAAVGTTVTYTATISGLPVAITATGSTETIPAVFQLHGGSPVAAGGGSIAVPSPGNGANGPVPGPGADAAASGGTRSLAGGALTTTIQQQPEFLGGSDAGAALGAGHGGAVSGIDAGIVADASPIPGKSAASVSVWAFLIAMTSATTAAAGIVRRRRIRLSNGRR